MTAADDHAAAVRRVLAGPAVLAAFALLVVPVVAGRLDGALLTPLALPGYLVFAVGSGVGSVLFPTLAPWVFWVPFVLGSYALAVVLAGAYRVVAADRDWMPAG